MRFHHIQSQVIKGHLTLLEHEAAKWLSKDNLMTVNWLPADQELVVRIKESIININ